MGRIGLALLRGAFFEAYSGDHHSTGWTETSLAPLRGAFLSLVFLRTEVIFRILDYSRWTWRDDVANHDPNLEAKCAQSLLTSHNW